MAREMWGLKVVAMVLGLLVMAPETMQVHVNHPLHGVVQRINANTGPFLALLVSSTRDEKMLMQSDYFVPNEVVPRITIAGRQFKFGMFKGAPVIVNTVGSPMAAVGVTLQILLDTFRIRGIIHYGAAGAVGNQLDLTDVVVPSSVAYTGVWQWQAYETSLKGDETVLPTLAFGDYNVPEGGENKLGSLEYQTVTLYTPTSSKKQTFWFPVHSDWVQIASTIKGIKLEKCMNRTMCTLGQGEIVQGVKTASADIYVYNEAYANFLRDNLDVAAVDTSSAAVVSTSIANGVPHIVFRGASNRPGEEVPKEIVNAAARNVLEAVAAFVERLIDMPVSGTTSSY